MVEFVKKLTYVLVGAIYFLFSSSVAAGASAGASVGVAAGASVGGPAEESRDLMKYGTALREESRFYDAIEAHRKGFDCAAEAKDTIEMVKHLNNIGTNFRRLGILEEASVYHYQALTLCDQYSDSTNNVARKNRVKSLNGIGNIQLSLGNLSEAESAFRSALKGETLLGSDLGQAINYSNIGSIHESLGQRDSARFYYQKSLESNIRAGSNLGISLCHSNFGRLLEAESKWDEALKEHKQAYDILSQDGDDWHWLESCLSMARVNLRKGDLKKCHNYLEEAKKVAQEVNSLEYLSLVYNLEYQYYEKMGSPRRALDSYVTSRAYSDSIATVKAINQMQNVRVRYERESRQKEIDLSNANLLAEKQAHNAAIIAFIALAVVAALIIAVLTIINYSRKSRQQMMKKMEAMRSNFFTNITHEFRSPLTSIIGLSKDIRDGHITEHDKIVQASSIIERQGNGLLELVNQLLDISRIESEIGSADWRKSDAALYVSMIVDVYSHFAQSRSIQLKFICNKETVEMDFVPDYLKKIVSNLISNAIKFSRDGGIVTVELIDRENEVALVVTDEGVGIAPDDLPHIFEAFYIGENSGMQTSTGVGLSLVNQLVEAMDGTIGVESVEGKGSKFTVILPSEHKESKILTTKVKDTGSVGIKIADKIQPEGKNDGEMEYNGRATVLIVEDNHDIAWYIGEHLRQEYNLLFASNGREGLEKAIQYVPDVIVTDYLMPQMDGLQLCSEVRSNELLNHIPIIIVTAKVAEQDRIRGLETGADAYLAKPFSSEELRARLTNLLEQRQLLREKYSKMVSLAITQKDDGQATPLPNDFMGKLIVFIQESLDKGERVDLTNCASYMCLSTRQLSRKIVAMAGFSPTQFINRIKLERAKYLLSSKPEMSITMVGLESGFESTSYFSRVFKQATGVTPSEFRNNV